MMHPGIEIIGPLIYKTVQYNIPYYLIQMFDPCYENTKFVFKRMREWPYRRVLNRASPASIWLRISM